jgi:deoxycytidylate deaminase
VLPKPLQYAVRIAEANETYIKWRLGSVIIKGGSVLSVGQSKLNCHPGLCDFDQIGIRERVSVHAEEDAIKRCGNPKGATVYVARIGRNGKVGLAEPCKRCKRMLTDAGVKRVIYTINSHNFDVWPS